MVGRDSKKKIARMTFDIEVRAAFKIAVDEKFADSHPNSKEQLRRATTSDVMAALFTKGFTIDTAAKKIKPCSVNVDGTEMRIGNVAFNKTAEDLINDPGAKRDAGLVFEICETS